jgi:hypothetical protein
MGLDIGENGKPEGEAAGESLRDVAESAIQQALRLHTNRVTFAFNTSAIDRSELATVCADLQKQYPGLQEIVPGRADNSATAYLNEKPSAFKKFLFSWKPAEI